MPHLPRLSLLTLLLCASLPALAEPARYNQVSLRSEVSREVSQDRMQVTLYTEAQDTDPAGLAKKVTETLNAAMLKSHRILQVPRAGGDVTIGQGSRRSYPIYDEKGQKIRAWRERAELRLEGADFPALSQLTGELLQTMSMGSMTFSISHDMRKRHEDDLLREAALAFSARAKLTSEALGGTGYRLISLNLHSNGQPVAYRNSKMMMAASEAVAPQVEPGNAQLSVQADGVIEVIMP